MAKVITIFLALILTLNNFTFSCKNYLQKLRHGNNLRTFKRKHLYGPHRKKIDIPIYQDISTYIPQTIDDIFFICISSETDLEKTLNELNT